MNKSDLKNFAIGARLALLQRVTDRAALYGVTEEAAAAHALAPSADFHKIDGTVMTAAETAQRSALIARVYQIGFRPAMEEAAYIWFNRLIAIRYMQEHALLPITQRPLPDAPGAQPRLISEAQDVSLPGVDMGRVLDMLDANRTDALYKYLLIALCNALSEPLPGMFEKISDATELLFPDGLLRADSVLGEMARLDGDSWQEIQVIGWLYQYYNTQLKDETFELLKKNVKITRERIGAATQLFTPEWIVRYMVENSLGRLWLEGHPNDALRSKWRYYMDEAPQSPDVAAQLAALRRGYAALQPEQLTVLDPCMGSAHILVYAFDVLMDIYRSVGYTDRDAVQSIVQHNLYGLDIDDRAAQLAYFALMMRACDYDRRFLRRGVQPHLYAIAESEPLDDAALAAFGAERSLARRLLDAFRDAKEYGSLLRPDFTPEELNRLSARMADMETAAPDTLLTLADHARAAAALRPLLTQAQILTRQYDAVITNPPYMGGSGMNEKLSRFVKEHYPDSKSDLFACFMEWGNNMVHVNGLNCMVTMQSWMFLSSFESMRRRILQTKDITCLMHMENMVLGIAFGTAVSILRNSHIEGYKGTYNQIKLCDIENEAPRAFPIPGNRFAQVSAQNFSKIPGAPVAYWVSETILNAYEKGLVFDSVGHPKVGMQTSNNDKYLRMWFEINYSEFVSGSSRKKWIKYIKGGTYRKWYGNLCYLLFYNGNPQFILQQPNARVQDESFLTKYKCTWTDLTSGENSFRIAPNDSFNDISGHCFYPQRDDQFWLLGYSNTTVFSSMLKLFNSTMHCQVGDVAKVVTPELSSAQKQIIGLLAQDNVNASTKDWDSFETSWDFKKHPMI